MFFEISKISFLIRASPYASLFSNGSIGACSNEKDKESNYADHGVRRYDDEIGRFTSIDPLWEKYYSWTPYQYSLNNPVSFLDSDGSEVLFENGWFNEEEKAAILEYIDLMEKSTNKEARDLAKKAKSKDYKITIRGGLTGIYSGRYLPEPKNGKCFGGIIEFKLSKFNTETIAHELWHFMQSITKTNDFFKEIIKDYKKPHDERSVEAGCDSFPGAIEMGKQIDKEVEKVNRNAKENIEDRIININNKNTIK